MVGLSSSPRLLPVFCVGAVLLVSALAFAQSNQSGGGPPVSFVGEIPAELTWEELQAGYPIRVENNLSQPLDTVAFRVRTAGISKEDNAKIKFDCEAVGNRVRVKGFEPPCKSLAILRPNLSNFFLLKATGERPISPFKLILLVNESNRRFPISKQITINTARPVIAKASVEEKLISITSDCFFPWFPINDVHSYCFDEKSFRLLVDQIGIDNSRFFLQKESGAGTEIILDLAKFCDKNTKNNENIERIVLNLKTVPDESLNLKRCTSNAEINSVTEANPGVYTNSYANLKPGIYKTKLFKVIAPSQNPVSLTLQIHRQPWIAILLALFGILLAAWLKRISGVITPTEQLLTRIHEAVKLYLDYREVTLPRNLGGNEPMFGYEIEPALQIRARNLEQCVRDVRANTTLVINDADDDYKKLVKDINALWCIPDQWHDLVRGLRRLESKRNSLVQQQTDAPDPILKDLFDRIQLCYGGDIIKKSTADATKADTSGNLSLARLSAKTALEKLAERAELWKTAEQDLENWQPKNSGMVQATPSVKPTKKQHRGVLLDALGSWRNALISWIATFGRHIKQRPIVYGSGGFSRTSRKDFLIAYFIPLLPLMITAYFDVYANNPGFGELNDFLKAFGWGFFSATAVQVFFAAIERLPIGKLFTR